eukprot:1470133-Rhodomonas_salina.1
MAVCTMESAPGTSSSRTSEYQHDTGRAEPGTSLSDAYNFFQNCGFGSWLRVGIPYESVTAAGGTTTSTTTEAQLYPGMPMPSTFPDLLSESS